MSSLNLLVLAAALLTLAHFFCMAGFIHPRTITTPLVVSIAGVIGASTGIVWSVLHDDADWLRIFALAGYISFAAFQFSVWRCGIYISRIMARRAREKRKVQ